MIADALLLPNMYNVFPTKTHQHLMQNGFVSFVLSDSQLCVNILLTRFLCHILGLFARSNASAFVKDSKKLMNHAQGMQVTLPDLY